MRYFSVTEWLKDAKTDDLTILRKIEEWIDILTPLRERLGEKIIITHGLRAGIGTSQHYFIGKGASDLRVDLSTPEYMEAMFNLGALLIDSDHINRVCYYPPGYLFPFGGFHIDRKTPGKTIFISSNNIVNWRQATGIEMLTAIRKSKFNHIDNDV